MSLPRKHEYDFAGSQAAMWEGKVVDVTDEPDAWLQMVNVHGSHPGYVPVQQVTAIGKIAKALLRGGR